MTSHSQPNVAVPDSAWLASVTAEAFQEHRFELGNALAKLAVTAFRMERDAEKMPAVPVSSLPVYEDVNRTGGIFTTGRAHVQPPALTAVQTLGHTCNTTTPEAGCAACKAEGSPWHLAHPEGPDVCVNTFGSIVTPGHESCAVVSHGDPHRPETEGAPALPDPIVVTPSARCVASVSPGAVCHAVLFWADYGDHAGWQHLDTERTYDHQPVPDRDPGTAVIPIVGQS